MSVRYVVTCDCGWTRTYARDVTAAALARHACPEPPRTHRRYCRTCGWSGTYKHAKVADRAKRQHSCAWQAKRREARARREARQAMRDRTPKPCLHKHARHQHGHRAAYVLDKCRCDPCTEAANAYARDTSRQQVYGRWDHYVDAEPVREHLRALMASGMGLKRIVALGHASGGTLNKILYGHPNADGTRRPPARRVRKETAQRVLAIRLDLAPAAPVDAEPTRRRLQALVALGWPVYRLGQRLGMRHPGNLWPVVSGHREHVTRATAEAVRDLYATLADQSPLTGSPARDAAVTRARRYAKARGWNPPLRIGGRLHVGPAWEVSA